MSEKYWTMGTCILHLIFYQVWLGTNLKKYKVSKSAIKNIYSMQILNNILYRILCVWFFIILENLISNL